MSIENKILIAFLIDIFIGDPRNWPHPVIAIGSIAKFMESITRKYLKNEYLAGFLTFFTVISLAGIIVFLICLLSYSYSQIMGDIISIFILYTTLSIKSLWKHSMAVYYALKKTGLNAGRTEVSKIVSRNCDKMTESDIIKATIESVSENIVDGITAPLFFAFLFGPVGAIIYKAINTLDSMFGYKNEKYYKFGFISAKIDDFANYLPARTTIPFILLASGVLFLHPVKAFKTMLKDHNKTPSPNSGISESLVAGALEIELGGNSYYFSTLSKRPKIGNAIIALQRKHILMTNRLMFLTACFSLSAFFCLYHLISG